MSLVRRILPLAVAAAILLAPAATRAGVTPIFVNAAATGANDGSSWANAYVDLQDALAAATDPAEIWVARGRYLPDAVDEGVSFQLKIGVAVFGGFAGTETTREQRDPDVNPTVLSGMIDLGDIQSDHVVDARAVGPTAILDGFEVSGGDGGGDAIGGGIWVEGGSPILRNLLVRENTASNGAAAIAITDGSPLVEDTIIAGNVSQFGGAVSNIIGNPVFRRVTFIANAARDAGAFGQFGNDGAPVFEDVRFIRNIGGASGGAIWFESGSKPILRNVLFLENRGALGGAVYDQGADSRYENVTFSGNAAGVGGAVYFEENGGTAILTNVTATGNGAREGGAFYNHRAATIVRQSIAWANGPAPIVEEPSGNNMTIIRSLLEGGCPAGTTCDPATTITADPGLLPLANGAFAESYPIGPGSPALDAGNNGECSAKDQRGVVRPVDGDLDGTADCDLGAYEFTPGTPRVAFAAASSGGSEKLTTVKLNVTLSEPSASAVSVKFRAAGGTARGGGIDYTLATGTLTFPARTTTRQVTLQVTNDRVDEPSETVLVRLFSPSGATLGSVALHTRTILDDDPRRTCRGRLATIVGTAGADTLTGTKGPDVIVALAGNDTVNGGGGDDVICAGAGNDRVNGGNGNDQVFGGPGGDTLRGGPGDDALYGNAGRDRLEGQAGTGDACDGGPGTDATPGAHGCEAIAGVP